MAVLPPPSYTVSLMFLLRWPLWWELMLLRVRGMGVHLTLCCPAGYGLCLLLLGLVLLGASTNEGWLTPTVPFLAETWDPSACDTSDPLEHG